MLIGLVGMKRSGKDTTADFILKHLGDALERDGGKAVKLAFAGKLKTIARDLYDLTEEQTNGPTEIKEAVIPEWGLSPRQIMQRLGTEVARSIHPETWIRYTMRQAVDFRESGLAVVITDVRFRNEAQAVREAGGWVIRVIRDGVVNFGDMHASEIEQLTIPVHATLPNIGTLEELQARTLELYGQLLQLESRG